MSEARIARKIESVTDAHRYMRKRLPTFLSQRYEAGSSQALTVKRNELAFEEISFLSRSGRWSEKKDLRTNVLGIDLDVPFMIAPTGALALGYYRGEVKEAKAAGDAGTAMVVSVATGTSIEEIAAATKGPLFFQLAYLHGRENSESMIQRAKDVGAKALVLTIDSQGSSGQKEFPIGGPQKKAFVPRSFAIGDLLRAAPQTLRRPAWLLDFLLHRNGLVLPMGPRVNGKLLTVFEINHAGHLRTPMWEDIPWIRERWDGPLVVKGMVTVADAKEAVNRGADAIVVSNHGGNSLDSRPSTISVLPRVVDAVGDQIEVWFDGGIRRGPDIAKALAMGARAVLVGHVALYGLMAAGEAGVAKVLQILKKDLEATMAGLGVSSIKELNRDYIDFPQDWLRPRI